MQKFMINSKNIFYKNHLIRTSDSTIGIVSYNNLISIVGESILRDTSFSTTPVCGNFWDGWYSDGLLISKFHKRLNSHATQKERNLSISEYKKFIDYFSKAEVKVFF